VIVVYSILWIEYLYTFNRINAGFNKEFFSDVSNRSTMGGLIYQNTYRGRNVYIHYPNYFLVWSKAPVTSKIIDYRFGIVRRAQSHHPLPYYNEFIGDGYHPLSQYKDMDYLLVRGKAPVSDDSNLHGFSLHREIQEWRLYRNKESNSPTP
jgi:hypothetical protein